jgi:hypothetical protein
MPRGSTLHSLKMSARHGIFRGSDTSETVTERVPGNGKDGIPGTMPDMGIPHQKVISVWHLGAGFVPLCRD